MKAALTTSLKDLLLLSLLVTPLSITSAQDSSPEPLGSSQSSGSSEGVPGPAGEGFDQFAPQQLGQRLALQAKLQNQRDQTVSLQKVLNGQPAVVLFTDFSCGQECRDQLVQVEDLLDQAAARANPVLSFLTPNQQYRRVAVSVNLKDTAAQAFAAQQYLDRGDNWHLLSTDSASTIAQLTSQAGLYDPFSQVFDPTRLPTDRIVLLDANGAVTDTFTIPHLTEQELSQAMLKAQDAALGFPLNQWVQNATVSLSSMSRLEAVQLPQGAALAPTLLLLLWVWFRFGRQSRTR